MGFLVFDYYGAWALAAKEPITATCMTSPSCFPPSFGAPSGLFSFNNQGLVIDDGDHFTFSSNPSLTALAFSGFETRGKPFGLAILGLGRLGGAPVYLFSSTGFIGVVSTNPASPWAPDQIIAAPQSIDVITQMYFTL
jgi:hypothetical protein